jgi:hypothetical protein
MCATVALKDGVLLNMWSISVALPCTLLAACKEQGSQGLVHCKLLQLHGDGTLACEGTLGIGDRLSGLRNVDDCIIACSYACAPCSAAAWHVCYQDARTEYGSHGVL